MARKPASNSQRFEIVKSTFSQSDQQKAAAFKGRKKRAAKKSARKPADPIPAPEFFLVFMHHNGMPHVQFPDFNEKLGTRKRVVHVTKIRLNSQSTEKGILISTKRVVEYQGMHGPKKKLKTHRVNTDLVIDPGFNSPMSQCNLWFRCDQEFVYVGIGGNAAVQTTKSNSNPTARLPQKGKRYELTRISNGYAEDAPRLEIFLEIA